MLKRIGLFLSFSIALFVSCSPEHSKIIVAEYADSQLTMAEFEKAYEKNSGSYEKAKTDSFEAYKNFADLYVNFKMKLRDAAIRGYDSDQTLMDELNDYKKKVGASYILEKQLVEPALKDLYELRKIEIRASHLMIRPDASGEEAAREYSQALLDSIKAGQATFEELVQRHSQDQFSKPNDGDIFYFTAAQLPGEFEEAAYKTDAGKVCQEVVKTQYGYHIIKVTDKKNRIAKVKASHVLASFTGQDGQVDSAAAKTKIDLVQSKINAGEDFAKLAQEFSDDTGTKENGGDLGQFERRMMVQPFDEAAFNLEVGEISDIITTNFGYHIIKLTEKVANPSFEEEKENLRNIYKKVRHQSDHNNLVNSLRTKFNYQIVQTTVDRIVGYADSTKIGADYPNMAEIGDESVFTYSDKNYSFEEFYEKFRADQTNTGKLFSPDIIKKAADKYSEELLLEEQAMDLDKTNKEFADLMDDYKNGIFIFKLQEEEVWNKVTSDSARLVAFYEKTKEKYTFPDRVSYTELYCRLDSVMNIYKEQIKAGADFDSLVVNYTERPGFKEKAGKYEFQVVGSNEFSKAVSELEAGEFTEPIKNMGALSILRLDKKETARMKTFEEAKAEVSGAFQEAESKRLEQEYIKKLKELYSPEINYDALEKAFQPEG